MHCFKKIQQINPKSIRACGLDGCNYFLVAPLVPNIWINRHQILMSRVFQEMRGHQASLPACRILCQVVFLPSVSHVFFGGRYIYYYYSICVFATFSFTLCFFVLFLMHSLRGQVVIRAQIPLLIALKNSFSCLRRTSGYSCFVNTYLSLIVAMAISFGIAYFLSRTAPTVSSFFYFVFAIIMVGFYYSTSFNFDFFPSPEVFNRCIFDA